MNKLTIAIVGIFMLFVVPSSHAADDAAPAKAFEKFYVYKDKPSPSHFAASGFMPDGRCVAINDVWVDNCGGSRSCIQLKFDRDCTASPGATGWAGIYWLEPANNWGDVKGGFNLKGAKKLVFSARGEKGGEVVTFKMGGVGMGGHPYR